MIKPELLYDSVKVPVDEHLLDELINRYLSVSLKDMEDENTNIENELYKKINIVSSNNSKEYNKEDLDKLIKKVNNDFIKSGSPYNPNEHNGVRNPLAIMPGWNTFKSWNLLGTERISSKETSHRFYFGVPNDKLYEFANVLYDYFKESKIPFYFKTESNQYVERTDKVVLYTSTPLLSKTLEVLEKIKKQRPDLINHCHEPSILTGKVDNKIGYASEDNTVGTSYTDMICKIFLNSIGDFLSNYIHENPDNQIKFMYHQKLKKYAEAGIEINSGRTKNRILFDILLHNDDVKQKLLEVFQNNLLKQGIDTNNMCFNSKAKKEIEDYYSNNIRLPNGDVITADEYLKKNGVLKFIPPESTVTLKNGLTLQGDEFIKGALERAGNFNSFQDLILTYVSKVDINRDNLNQKTSNIKK